ncbi:Os03g0679950 [Oryza sativa Japonica Group]|uniref:Os03g0679950 protein n=1 Tax=Oryza sativa subsp. japonica TaxID=39947 RepID=C7IZF8_ORYSJ|nr:Os03g0679950 [Oryza sativa Japonica Group]|eukprot:NP_001173582.1 Os03g0679950 [Oryza sativa Japonica Group]
MAGGNTGNSVGPLRLLRGVKEEVIIVIHPAGDEVEDPASRRWRWDGSAMLGLVVAPLRLLRSVEEEVVVIVQHVGGEVEDRSHGDGVPSASVRFSGGDGEA